MKNNPDILLLALYGDGMRNMLEEIGLCFIASYLRKNNHNVTLMVVNDGKDNISENLDFVPDVIGITIYDVNKLSVYKICKELKELFPDVIICVGGSSVTYNSVKILEECSYIDYGIRGEGEYAFLMLMKYLQHQEAIHDIQGLTYRINNQIVENPEQENFIDLESLPFPARDILEQTNTKIAIISSSRGCKARCSFCASQLLWRKWRGQSAKKVVDEIESIVTNYKIKAFDIIDDSFEDSFKDGNRMYDIASEIIKRNLRIFYYIHIRGEFHKKANEELMQKLVDSGLSCACIGIEAGNELDLRLYNKTARLNDIITSIHLLNQYNIALDPGFINFNPYSNFDRLRTNVEFLKNYGFAANIEYLMTTSKLYKGTKLFEKVKSDNLLASDENSNPGFYFLDPKIQPLHHFVVDYIQHQTNRNISNSFKAITYFTTKRRIAISCYKRLFNKPEHVNAYNLVLGYDKIHEQNCTILNNQIYKWFIELLELAEDKWDIGEAEKITENTLNEDFLVGTATTLNNEKNIFNKRLLKLNFGYSEHLLDYLAGS